MVFSKFSQMYYIWHMYIYLIREETKHMFKLVMTKVIRHIPSNVHIMISDIQ